MKYVCEICVYSTDDVSNYNKHRNSKSHTKRVEANNHKKPDNQPQNLDKNVQICNVKSTFQCKNCNNVYTLKTNLKRHQKNCKSVENKESELLNNMQMERLKMECDKKVYESEFQLKLLQKDNDMLKKDVLLLNKQLDEQKKAYEKDIDKLNLDIEQYKETIDKLTRKCDNGTDVLINHVTSTMKAQTQITERTMTFLENHFNKAPPLQKFDRYHELKSIDFNQNPEKNKEKDKKVKKVVKMFPTIEEKYKCDIPYNKTGELMVCFFIERSIRHKIGDLITNYYQKKNPLDQQVWVGDLNRIKFIIRQPAEKDIGLWKSDESGMLFNKLIVTPIVHYFGVQVHEFVSYLLTILYEHNDNIGDSERSVIDKYIQMGQLLLKKIKEGKTQDQIIKYSKKFFKLDTKEHNKKLFKTYQEYVISQKKESEENEEIIIKEPIVNFEDLDLGFTELMEKISDDMKLNIKNVDDTDIDDEDEDDDDEI